MIKRCPSCGRKAEVKENAGFWGVHCSNCNFNILPEYETREDAIKVWNKRTDISFNLNPESVANFLEENDWVKKDVSEDYALFVLTEHNIELFDVRIPLKYGSDNFEADMQDAIEKIADIQFDTPEDIIDSIWDEQVYCTQCFNFVDGKCIAPSPCYFGDPEDSAPASMRQNYRTIELGNLLWGHSRGMYPIDRDMIESVFLKYFEADFDYHMYYEGEDKNKTTERGGYENDVFKVNPYYWGDDENIADEPNFIYKPGNIEISWYKYPMRDAYANTLLTEEKAEEIFRKCRDSMK